MRTADKAVDRLPTQLVMTLSPSDALAVTAIVISLIALVSTIGQIVQQYLGTSDGYRRCRSSVMGRRGQYTRRKLDYGEMRFEVFFQTPVIFLENRGDARGLLLYRVIEYLEGSLDSYPRTLTEDLDMPGVSSRVWNNEQAS